MIQLPVKHNIRMKLIHFSIYIFEACIMINAPFDLLKASLSDLGAAVQAVCVNLT